MSEERLPVAIMWDGRKTLIRGLAPQQLYWMMRAMGGKYAGRFDGRLVLDAGPEGAARMRKAICREVRSRVAAGQMGGYKLAHWLNAVDPMPCVVCGGPGHCVHGELTTCLQHKSVIEVRQKMRAAKHEPFVSARAREFEVHASFQRSFDSLRQAKRKRRSR